ncbi:MAG: 50S ribosomal protein L21 [bacterium]|nr:50S ribosomal protein L21 [bacterium]
MRYAIVETGGKQFRVMTGDLIKVEKLNAEIGTDIELDKVLLVSGDDKLEIGKPYVAQAKVVAEVTDQDKSKKIRVFKYKRRKKYRKLKGHRQAYTELKIKEIIT